MQKSQIVPISKTTRKRDEEKSRERAHHPYLCTEVSTYKLPIGGGMTGFQLDRGRENNPLRSACSLRGGFYYLLLSWRRSSRPRRILFCIKKRGCLTSPMKRRYWGRRRLACGRFGTKRSVHAESFLIKHANHHLLFSPAAAMLMETVKCLCRIYFFTFARKTSFYSKTLLFAHDFTHYAIITQIYAMFGNIPLSNAMF